METIVRVGGTIVAVRWDRYVNWWDTNIFCLCVAPPHKEDMEAIMSIDSTTNLGDSAP